MHGKEPHSGPKGLYSSSTTGQYIYADAAANGYFATTFPADCESFIANTHIFSIKIPETTPDLSAAFVWELLAVTPRSAKRMARQTVGCGEVCVSTQVSGGRAWSWQRLMLFFTSVFLEFAATNRASIPFLITSREG